MEIGSMSFFGVIDTQDLYLVVWRVVAIPSRGFACLIET
jgi:hypothetical protein